MDLSTRAKQIRHFAGFVVAGVSALAVDVAVLQALVSLADWPALYARCLSIAGAMVVSYFINRSVTFGVHTPPSLREFGTFAAACWLTLTVNYIVFVAILTAVPGLVAGAAVVGASLVSMFVSYVSFRWGVFRPAQNPAAAKHQTTQAPSLDTASLQAESGRQS